MYVCVCLCVDVSQGLSRLSVIEWGNIVCVGDESETHLSLKGVDDEVQRMRLNTLDTLLHHVVTVLVLHTLQHVAVQLPHHLALQGEGGGGGGGSQQRDG